MTPTAKPEDLVRHVLILLDRVTLLQVVCGVCFKLQAQLPNCIGRSNGN
jgi:hypothetical protein